MSEQAAEAEALRGMLFRQNPFGYVNLTEESLQDLPAGFLVGSLELKQYLTGYRLEGLIINSRSIHHEDATFRLVVGKVTREFTIHDLPPGTAGKFSVYIPDLKADDALIGQIQYLQSSIKYLIARR